MKRWQLPLIVLGGLLMLVGLGAGAYLISTLDDIGAGEPGGTAVTDAHGLRIVDPADLPPEARTTLALIERGGPYPYGRDDTVFQNREQLLPRYPGGYYREYTVDTPGSRDRGARRIVAGSGGERYYTDDHYESFVRVGPVP